MNRTQEVGGFESPQLHSLASDRSPPRKLPGAMSRYGGDPEQQANLAFALIVVGILAVGGLTLWFFYGTR